MTKEMGDASVLEKLFGPVDSSDPTAGPNCLPLLAWSLGGRKCVIWTSPVRQRQSSSIRSDSSRVVSWIILSKTVIESCSDSVDFLKAFVSIYISFFPLSRRYYEW
jgi:hypothetical protein